MTSFRRSALLTTALAFASPALADFINAPFNSGLSAVNITGVSRDPGTGIYALSGPVFDATGRQLQIGSSASIPGGVASLTINNQVGTYDVIGLDNLSLTYVGNGSAGALTVDGAGAFINSDTIWFGLGNSAEINITNGGVFSGERTFVGLDNASGVAPGDVTVSVDGAGSRWETETVTIGSSSVATTSSATVTVSNGAVLSAEGTPGDAFPLGQIYVGGRDGLTQDDSLTITGAGSLAEASQFFGVIGGAGNDILRILDGGAATAPTMSIGAASRDGSGTATLLVSGQDGDGVASSVTLTGDLNIGFGPTFVGWDGPCCDTPIFKPADGRAIVENGGVINVGGAVNVSNGGAGVDGHLTLASGGTINGDVNVNAGGVLDGNGGSIVGNLTVNGGTLAPGASPGTMIINGDLILDTGILELEIDATGQDLLDVNGDVILGSGLVIDLFIDTMLTDLLSIESFFTGYSSFNIEAGFNPLTDIHLFAGANSGFAAGDNLRIGLGGQEFLLSFNQTSTVPTPGILALLILGLGALSLSRRRAR